jgi:O-antigen ligase
MIAACFCVLFLGVGGGALSAIGRNSTLTGRTEVWQTVLPFVANAWVGAGYENFWIGQRLQNIARAVGAGLNQAHNGYIEIYLNIGYVGIILLGGIICTGYRNIMQGLRRDPDVSRLKLALFLIALVYNFTEAAFKMMSPVWMLFLLAAIAAPTSRLAQVRSKESAGARPEWFGMANPKTAMAETASPWVQH